MATAAGVSARAVFLIKRSPTEAFLVVLEGDAAHMQSTEAALAAHARAALSVYSVKKCTPRGKLEEIDGAEYHSQIKFTLRTKRSKHIGSYIDGIMRPLGYTPVNDGGVNAHFAYFSIAHSIDGSEHLDAARDAMAAVQHKLRTKKGKRNNVVMDFDFALVRTKRPELVHTLNATDPKVQKLLEIAVEADAKALPLKPVADELSDDDSDDSQESEPPKKKDKPAEAGDKQ